MPCNIVINVFEYIKETRSYISEKPRNCLCEISNINRIMWIMLWAEEAIMKFQYLELDATFEPTKPYILVCPQIISNGLAIPSGFNLAPIKKLDVVRCFLWWTDRNNWIQQKIIINPRLIRSWERNWKILQGKQDNPIFMH